MSALIPSPAEIAQRYMASFAQAMFRTEDGSMVTIDPSAPSTFEQVLVSAMALSDYETYLYIRDRFLELLPTTATIGDDGLLPQHGQIWGVSRLAPRASVGKVIIKAVQHVSLPQGTALTKDGTVQWTLNQAVSIAAGETQEVSVTCQEAGLIGNLAADTTLSLVSPVTGVASVTVNQNGFTGGSDIETADEWRSRIIEAIRKPYNGGSTSDYRKWASNAGAQYINVVPSYTGPGTVGVIIAYDGPRVPTDDEVARVQAYIDEQKTVIAHATIYAAELVNETPIVRLGIDNQINREKVKAAFQSVYNNVKIGETLYLEALQAALFNVAGGNSMVISPSRDIPYRANQIPCMVSISWQDADK